MAKIARGKSPTPQLRMIDGHTTEPDEFAAQPRRAAKIRRGVLLAIGGGLLTIAGLLVIWVISSSRQRLPELTRKRFDAARAQWNAANPNSYTIETEVVGRQPATYRVQLADGQIVVAQRNDYPLKDQRTLGTWSVPGMFGTIEHDLLATEQPATAAAGPRSELHLRAEFDPQWGYPKRYLRVEWGTDAQVSWTVQQFTTADSSADSLEREPDG